MIAGTTVAHDIMTAGVTYALANGGRAPTFALLDKKRYQLLCMQMMPSDFSGVARPHKIAGFQIVVVPGAVNMCIVAGDPWEEGIRP